MSVDVCYRYNIRLYRGQVTIMNCLESDFDDMSPVEKSYKDLCDNNYRWSDNADH